MKKVEFSIDDDIIELQVEGDTFYGSEEVLLHNDDDLTRDTAWHERGYTVKPFLTDVLFDRLYDGITKILKQFVEEEVGNIDAFTLDQYHHYCADDALHLRVVSKFQKCLPIELFPIDYIHIEKRVSEICGVAVTLNHPRQELPCIFCIRIVRPQSKTDNNPPHRDVWLNRLRDAVNIYVPLAGSNERSSLPLIPGSHLWMESEIERTVAGSKVNNIAFSVPCVVNSVNQMHMIRPSVNTNEVMVFSPYLIHGGGANLNTDKTRVSLEMRFWRKP